MPRPRYPTLQVSAAVRGEPLPQVGEVEVEEHGAAVAGRDRSGKEIVCLVCVAEGKMDEPGFDGEGTGVDRVQDLACRGEVPGRDVPDGSAASGAWPAHGVVSPPAWVVPRGVSVSTDSENRPWSNSARPS